MPSEGAISRIEQYVVDFVLALRKDKGQTQTDLANILGVSRSFVKDVESKRTRAKYNLNHINTLADYFDLRPGQFLPEKALIKPKPKKSELQKPSRVKKSATKKISKSPKKITL